MQTEYLKDMLEKTKMLDQKDLDIYHKFMAGIMLSIQAALIFNRDNERFEDWSFDKVIERADPSKGFIK